MISEEDVAAGVGGVEGDDTKIKEELEATHYYL